MKFIKAGKNSIKKAKENKNKEKNGAKTTKEDKQTTISESNFEDDMKGPMMITFGKPVLLVSYTTIKFYATLAAALLIINILFAFKLIVKSIKLRVHFGYFINLISKPDGDVLPSVQAVPTFLYMVVDIAAIYLVYKLFSEKQQQQINFILFITILVGLVLVLITFIIFIFIMAHIYSEHASLHDGMMEAMKVYNSDTVLKTEIDRLQIEFQCCGSKKYEEWYELEWYDASLVTGGNKSETSSTPFSCCSKASIFPCIHHDIEKTGTTYLYTPEYNLSISTSGCYDILRQRKKQVGWGIIGNMFLLVILNILLMVSLRFLQTGHFERGRFDGSKSKYTIWLFGCYRGRKIIGEPPEPPPVPVELMMD